ncbi:MAG: glycosyltransferase family 4 protein [Candidatus Sulfobium sp.]
MKILFVSLFFPRENSFHAGGRYVFEVIRELSARHEIYLATRLEESEIPLLSGLHPFCKDIYPYIYRTREKRGALDVLRLLLNYAGFSRFARKLSGNGDFDIVQVEWTEAGVMMKKMKTPMVLDAHDVITKPAERRAGNLRGIRRSAHFLAYILIRNMERRIVKKFDMVFTLSDFDRKYLAGLQPGLRIRTVPVPAGLDITEKKFKKDRNTILFLASYKYRRVNVEAALYFYRSVFPLVRKEVPDAKFIAAGYGPPEELTALREKDPNVEVPGFVEDIDECYKKAAVFVAPILVGGGIIVKILDAMAAGTPVVTTSYGNEGIGAVPGRDLLVADGHEAFAAAVSRLLMDAEFAAEIGANGRAFVRRNYSRQTVISEIESAYEELAGMQGEKRLEVRG